MHLINVLSPLATSLQLCLIWLKLRNLFSHTLIMMIGDNLFQTYPYPYPPKPLHSTSAKSGICCRAGKPGSCLVNL